MSKDSYNLEEKKMKEKCEKCNVENVNAWFKGAGVCTECYNNEKNKGGK